MDTNTFPTKGNLILAKNSLSLADQGYDLMDKKRNILIRELLELIDKAKNIQSEIDVTFTAAYLSLQRANIEMGIRNVEDLSSTVPEENSVVIKQRSIMGTDIPLVEFNESDNKPTYSFYDTRLSLDEATNRFKKVKELTLRLAMIENSAYRLASNIKKTQKRANALKNITIPFYTQLVHDIQNSLEEREREEFTRLKVIKQRRSVTHN
ncbi:MAG: V-type ATP synthase subunit D [Anaerocolumna sp.]